MKIEVIEIEGKAIKLQLMTSIDYLKAKLDILACCKRTFDVLYVVIK